MTPRLSATSTSKSSPLPVDGAWFALVERTWAQVPSPVPAAPMSSIPEGYFSIDGAWHQVVEGTLTRTSSPLTAPASAGNGLTEARLWIDRWYRRVGASGGNSQESS
jgi:hypothetical protein